MKDRLWRDMPVYCADVAQEKHEINVAGKGPSLKIGKDHKLAKHIERKIKEEKFSPDAVIGEIKEKNMKFKTNICTKTVYNYIDKEIFLGISNKDLPVKKKGYKRKYRKRKVALHNLKGRSIEERPVEAVDRAEHGYWEMDCVVGSRKASSAVLLVLSERKSREEIIIKMKDKNQRFVISKLNKLEKKYGKDFKEKFKTITVDNGVEFLNHEMMESSVRNKRKKTEIFYAHPYSSWERGTNENTNKLIRRFIPKGSDIGEYSDLDIERIQHWINNYPRKIFGYKCANDIIA
jgi:IS30 family transposase